MQVFTGGSFGRVHTLRLDAGDYLLESIEALIKAEQIDNAAVVSAIGTLDYCVLHMVTTTGYPPVERFVRWEDKPLELSSVSGIIAKGVPHLHMVVSDDKMAYSGHVEPGCRVLYLAEIVLVELTGFHFERVLDERNIKKLRDRVWSSHQD